MILASETNIRTRSSLRSAADAGGVAVKQENAQLRVITDELSHRIKNLVAIIQSIARQTMHEATTKDDFEGRFSAALERLVVPSIFSSPMNGAECTSANSWARS